jgi:DNA-binding NtrC family response regulator
VAGLSPAFRTALTAHSWPGNVRELEKAVRRAVTLADDGAVLGPELLPVAVLESLDSAGGPAGGPASFAPDSFKQVLEEAVVLAKTNKMDVILMSHYRAHPFFEAAQRIDQYRQAMLALAQKHGVGFADLLTAWDDQKYQGYPPLAELHNNNNHPGVRGHTLTAELLLEFFK